MKSLEIARFRVVDGPELLTAREVCMRAVAQAFPAFVSERLVRFEDGTFADEIVWASREDADRAAAEVPALPEAGA